MEAKTQMNNYAFDNNSAVNCHLYLYFKITFIFLFSFFYSQLNRTHLLYLVETTIRKLIIAHIFVVTFLY